MVGDNAGLVPLISCEILDSFATAIRRNKQTHLDQSDHHHPLDLLHLQRQLLMFAIDSWREAPGKRWKGGKSRNLTETNHAGSDTR